MLQKTGSSDDNLQTLQGEDLADLKKRGGGLTLAKLENLLSDIRFQPQWRLDADICEDYYDSHQLKAERLELMERLGVPPLITNLIAPVVNSVLGLEVKSRVDSRVSEADEAQMAPEELILAMNAKQNEAERESKADLAVSEAYASMIKGGVGWVEVTRESDPFLFPYRVQAVHRNEIWWDWRAKRLDLADARYLIRKRRFDVDMLLAFMPEHRDLIEAACADRLGSWQLDTELLDDTGLAYAAHLERITDIDSSEWRDAERKRATVYEVWYREWVVKPLITLPNGRVIPYDPKDEVIRAAIALGRVSQPERRVYTEVRVAFYLGCHRLYDLPSPYPHRHFPYVPFFGYKEGSSGIRYGIIRSMISPQDVVNSADAKMHHMLNNKRIVADSDAIDPKYNTWSQVQEQVAKPNAVVLLDPAKRNSRFTIDSENQLNEQQFKRRMQAAADIEAAGGVYKAMLGRESNTTSGVGINSLIEQSTVMLSEINDNYSHARRMVNELLFELVKEDLIEKEVRVPIKRNGKKEIVVLNQRTVDETTGQQVILNDIQVIDFKVTLNEVPNTASFKAQQLNVLTTLAASLPAELQVVLVPAMIMMSDIPDREEIAEQIKRQIGYQPKLSDEEQAAADAAAQEQAQKAMNMQERLAEANIKLLEQKVANLEAQNRKIDAERINKMIEAMYSAMQGGQIVIASPGVTPVADELLSSAGFKDDDGDNSIGPDAATGTYGPQEQQIPSAMGDPGFNPGPPSADIPQPEPAAPPSPAIGVKRGIETLGNDGTAEPLTSPAQA